MNSVTYMKKSYVRPTTFIKQCILKQNCLCKESPVALIDKGWKAAAPMSPIRRKLVVVGDGACGKTSLLSVFSTHKFPEFYVPTVFETDVSDIEVNGEMVELALWDTAGQEAYDRLRPLSYPDTDVVLMCFSIDSPDSLANVLEKWAPEVRHFCGQRVPLILVGNKIDLRHDKNVKNDLSKFKQAPLTSEEGRAMFERIKAYAYKECSAKTREGVRDVFETAAKATLKTKLYNPRQWLKCRIL